MHCREAKHRLSRIDRPDHDDDLQAHLAVCTACAEFARTERLLAQTIAECRETPEPASDFTAVRARLQAYPDRSLRKEDTLMSKIQSSLLSHPKASIGFSLAVVAFLFVMLVPFSYSKTVGYNVTFSNLDNNTNVPTSKLIDALQKLGYNDVSVNFNTTESGMDYAIANLPNKQAIQDATFLFNLLSGQRVAPEVKPIVKEVSGTLYAQATENLFQTTIEIDHGRQDRRPNDRRDYCDD